MLGHYGRIGESQRRLLDHLISCRQAPLVLTEVFFPGGNPEDFDEAIPMFGVSVQLPSGRTGTKSG